MVVRWKLNTEVSSYYHLRLPISRVNGQIREERHHSCNIQDPKMNSNGKLQKVIEGACIEGEWERLVGAIGMIVNAAEFKSQIMAGNLTFGTAYASPDYGTYIYSVFAAILIEYMPVGSSPSTNRGARRVSGPNPFSRGPGGAGGATLACHDIGVSCYIVIS